LLIKITATLTLGEILCCVVNRLLDVARDFWLREIVIDHVSLPT
jgi:hypothetical protein